MPWKGEKDPYKIWLSEIILQQTRVEQGWAYFERFIAAFPTIKDLAAADDQLVFKYWEGLGYYSRCRNLIHTARFIAKEYKGKFPETYDAIGQLKGVGPYTAAAISSFAFGLPYAVVDGNVYRVLSRIFGISTASDSTEGKKQFGALAQQLIDPRHAGMYNQAIMDFGAVVCKPVTPLCTQCIFKKECIALKTARVADLPVKQKKLTVKKRWFSYLVIRSKNTIVIRQRTSKDIWRDLYEFPLIESDRHLSADEMLKLAKEKKWFTGTGKIIVKDISDFEQQLTHQRIHGQFLIIDLNAKPSFFRDWEWVPVSGLGKYAFPRSLKTFIQRKIS